MDRRLGDLTVDMAVGFLHPHRTAHRLELILSEWQSVYVELLSYDLQDCGTGSALSTLTDLGKLLRRNWRGL